MSSPRLQPSPLQLLSLAVALSGSAFSNFVRGSKANVRKDETNSSAQPAAVEVTTAPAIVRELPRFFEATGSLTGDETLSLARQNYASVMTARANVANAESQLNLARRNLSYANVYSPIDGYVSDRPADLGEYVSPTTKVATVVRINPLRVRIDIPEQAIPARRPWYFGDTAN